MSKRQDVPESVTSHNQPQVLTLPALTYTLTTPLVQKLAPKFCKGTNSTVPRVQHKFWNNLLLAVPLTPRSCTWHLFNAVQHSYTQRWQGRARKEFTIQSAEEIRVSWIIHLEAGQGLGLLPEEAVSFARPLKGSTSELPAALAHCNYESRASTSSVLLLPGRLSWDPGILSCQWWQGAETLILCSASASRVAMSLGSPIESEMEQGTNNKNHR